jgi:hypothetical protein
MQKLLDIKPASEPCSCGMCGYVYVSSVVYGGGSVYCLEYFRRFAKTIDGLTQWLEVSCRNG